MSSNPTSQKSTHQAMRAYKAALERDWLHSGLFTEAQRALMAQANYDASHIAPDRLPEILREDSGEPVLTEAQWHARRRPELLDHFETLIYGRGLPATPVHAEVFEQSTRALARLATRTQAWLHTASLRLQVVLYLPQAASSPVPCFLGMNFQGNHAAFADPAIPLSERWMMPRPGVADHRATEAARGINAAAWPLETILRRGYALATLYYGDVEPDHAQGFAEGPRARLLAAPCDEARQPDEAGTLAAWAWGLSRVMDYLITVPQIDAARVCLTGHSRLGKAALWASACDPRFAGVIANNTGCAGAAPNRRNFGETLSILSGVRPYWFARNCARLSREAPTWPIDQHMLIALSAPRAVLISSAAEDYAADPEGEFASARAASPVYRLLGTEGLAAERQPPPGRLIASRLGYWIRSGGHAITPRDWDAHLDFADCHLAPTNWTG